MLAMKKVVPYVKLSKKEKKKFDSLRRNSWGSLKPITRVPENSKAYDREKARGRRVFEDDR